ncbi:MAG: RecX family transcriptional regulator [Rhodospirillales bacterium]|nr:RecX family transcriptional regulator [Rhodospirillales bacterium]
MPFLSTRRTSTKPPKEPTAESLRNAALFYLERFPASAARVRQVLERRIMRYCRCVPDSDPQTYMPLVSPIIESLCAAGYIDDLAYARGLYASFARKGVAARTAAQKMRLKGISSDLIEQVCATQENRSGNDDFLRALRFARRKKIGPFAPETGGRTPEKSLAALARAGFDYETAATVMKTDRTYAADLVDQEPL